MKSLLCWGKGGRRKAHTWSKHTFSLSEKHAWRQQSRPFRRVRTNFWIPQPEANPRLPKREQGPPLAPPRTALCVSISIFWRSDACLWLFPSFPGIPPSPNSGNSSRSTPQPRTPCLERLPVGGVSRETRLGTPPARGPFQAPRIRKENRTVLNKKKSELFGQEATVVLSVPAGDGWGPVSPFPFQ